MRIIAGTHRGRKLITLDGLQTRPTLDGTKEAIFSSIGPYLTDYKVLDLFGGSGALSLESLSRGASFATIIDNNPEAIDIIKQNARTLGLFSKMNILQGDYKTILTRFKDHDTFDLVFIDPPFRMKVIDEIITYLSDKKLVKIGGYIIAEYPKEDIVCKDYEGYEVHLCRRYSSSEVLILERVA